MRKIEEKGGDGASSRMDRVGSEKVTTGKVPNRWSMGRLGCGFANLSATRGKPVDGAGFGVFSRVI